MRVHTFSKLGTVNLDTSRLSDLALSPRDPGCAEVLLRLQSGEAFLVISIFHLVELAHPKFKDADEVESLLNDCAHVLANPFEDIAEEEVEVACAIAIGRVRTPPRVFARDTSEWGRLLGPAGGTAVDMLKAFRKTSSPRQALVDMASHGAKASMLKASAALIRDPLLPLTLAVEDHLKDRRSTLPSYAEGLSAAEIIQRVGGVRAFSGYSVQEALVAERMKDPGQKSTANDVFDDYIAFYAPYCAATSVDRATLHRARVAKLGCIERMTHSLSDVPDILDRVARGELTATPSA